MGKLNAHLLGFACTSGHSWRIFPFSLQLGPYWAISSTKSKLSNLSWYHLFLFPMVWWQVGFIQSRLLYASLGICNKFMIRLVFTRGLFHCHINVECYDDIDWNDCKESTQQCHRMGRQLNTTCLRCILVNYRNKKKKKNAQWEG